MPVQFGDFTKAVNDIFDKSGFGTSQKFKTTVKTPAVFGGGGVSCSTEVKDKKAKITGKWKHESGFNVGKFEYNFAKNAINLETSYNDFPSVKGMELNVKVEKDLKDGGKTSLPIEVTYESGDVLAAGLECNAPDFDEFTANVTLATEGLMVGSSLKFDKGGSAPSDYPISLSYDGGDYFAAVEATNELRKFTLLGSYKATPQLTVASKFMIPDNNNENYSLAGVYKTGDSNSTKLAGMFSYDSTKKGGKTLDLSYTAKPVDTVEVSASVTAPINDPSNYSTGFSLTLG